MSVNEKGLICGSGGVAISVGSGIWIFIHGTNIDIDLIVLFFSLFLLLFGLFSVALLLEIFLPTPLGVASSRRWHRGSGGRDPSDG